MKSINMADRNRRLAADFDCKDSRWGHGSQAFLTQNTTIQVVPKNRFFAGLIADLLQCDNILFFSSSIRSPRISI